MNALSVNNKNIHLVIILNEIKSIQIKNPLCLLRHRGFIVRTVVL